MLKKAGRFYADWRDPEGRRKRKAFDTKRAAVAHQTRMQKASADARDSRPTKRRRG